MKEEISETVSENGEDTNGGGTSDEAVLNVLRKADRPFLRTREFTDELDIVHRTVQKKLKRLEEEEGRLESERVGQPKLWWLDPAEPDEPQGESGAKVLRLCNKLSEFGDGLFRAWVGLFGIAGFLLLLFLAAEVSSITFPLVNRQSIVQTVFFFSFCGGIGVSMWGITQLIVIATRTALKREWIGTVGV